MLKNEELKDEISRLQQELIEYEQIKEDKIWQKEDSQWAVCLAAEIWQI